MLLHFEHVSVKVVSIDVSSVSIDTFDEDGSGSD